MKKFLLPILAVAVITVSSCQKWLDVNYNPNAVTEVDNGLIIPSIELNLMNITGFYGHMLGSFFSQHYAIKPGGPQYLGLAHWDNSNISSSVAMGYSNFLYSDAYTNVIGNSTSLRKKAAESEKWGDYLAATVMRVYAFQLLVDAFGEVPYSQAMNTANLAPSYDEGKDVYAGIIKELDEALSKVSVSDEVSDNMLFSSSSSASNWIEFANALKLRILMRESGKVDVKAALASLVAENNFPKKDIGFVNCWANQSGLDNPVFDEMVRVRGNLATGRTIETCANMAVASAMTEVNDARLPAKFNASKKYNNYEGCFIDEQMSKEIDAKFFGDKSNSDQENTYAELNIKYDSPVYLMTVSETEFFLAEYYSLIASDDAKAKSHYEAAIDASFKTCGVSGSSDIYGAGKKYAWDKTKAAEIIGVQKWVSLVNVNGFESWCELRRTGYPAFNSKTGEDIYKKWKEIATKNVADGKANPTPLVADLIAAGVYTAGTVYTPVYVVGLKANTLLGHLMFPTSTTQTNSSAPKQKDPDAKIFWAK